MCVLRTQIYSFFHRRQESVTKEFRDWRPSSRHSCSKAATLALSLDADHVITPGNDSLEQTVMDLTDGRGVDVVYDAVGCDTFGHSIAALANQGHLVCVGQASGPVGSHDVGAFASKSISVSRPNCGHYTDTREKMMGESDRLFDLIIQRKLSVNIGGRLPLAETVEAHRLLESRASTGSILLIPQEVSTR